MIFPDLSNVMRKKKILAIVSALFHYKCCFLRILWINVSCHRTIMVFTAFVFINQKRVEETPPLHTSQVQRSGKWKEPTFLFVTWPSPGCRLLNKNAVKNSDCKAKYLKILRCLNKKLAEIIPQLCVLKEQNYFNQNHSINAAWSKTKHGKLGSKRS